MFLDERNFGLSSRTPFRDQLWMSRKLTAHCSLLIALCSLLALLSACTDYSQQFEDDYAYGRSGGESVINGDSLLDKRDNISYAVRKVGNLLWMMDDLAHEYYSDESYKSTYCYQDRSRECDKTGRLYPGEHLDYACPQGWRLPTKEEWKSFYSTSVFRNYSTERTNLFKGYVSGDHSLNELNYKAYYWTSGEVLADGYNPCVSFDANFGSLSTGELCHEQWKLSVRCVAEAGSQSTAQSSAQTTKKSSSSAKSSTAKSSSSMMQTEWINAEPLKDSRDNRTYSTVTIGKQTWMAKNLNYGTDNSYCYDNLDGNCSLYGQLYTWNDAITVCPSGWHLPTVDEWKTLFLSEQGDAFASTMDGKTCNIYGNSAPSFANISVEVKPTAYQNADKCSVSGNWKDCGDFIFKIINNAGVDYKNLKLRFYVGMEAGVETPVSYLSQIMDSAGRAISATQIVFGDHTADGVGQFYIPITIKGTFATGSRIYFQVKWLNDTFHKLQGGWSLVEHPGDDYIESFDGVDLTQAPYFTGNELAEQQTNSKGEKVYAFTPDPYIPVYADGKRIYGYAPDETEKTTVRVEFYDVVYDKPVFWTATENGDEAFIIAPREGSDKEFVPASKNMFGLPVRCVKD